MPIIPLLRPSPTTPTAGPRMALDNERRPTIDTRGIAGAVGGVADAAGQLARSSQMPDLPDELANGYRALGAVGSAIADAGSVIGALAIKRREAESIAQVAEAEAQIDMEEADFENWKQAHPNPSEWEGEWANRLGKIQAIAANEKLNEGAKRRLAPSIKAYAGKSSLRVATDASSTTFRNAAGALLGSVSSAIDKGEFGAAREKINEGLNSAYFFPEKAQSLLLAVDEAERNQIKLRAENLVNENNPQGAKDLFNNPLFNKDQQKNEHWRVDGIYAKKLEDDDRTAKIKAAQTESEVLGDLMWRKANGETVMPEQIDDLVKNQKMDKATAARLKVTLKSEIGAMPNEFMDFLNKEVDAYDSDEDPDGLKSFALRERSDLLGLNQRQRELFEARLQRAAKVNTDPKLKPLEAVRRVAKQQIGEMFKDVGSTRVWNTDLELALRDPAKTKAWGMPEEQAAKVKMLIEGGKDDGKTVIPDKAAALKLFKDQSLARKERVESGLTEWEYNLFQKAADSKDDMVNDPIQQQGADFNRAILEEGFDNWYDYETQKRGAPPSEVEARDWVGNKTRAVLQGIGAANLFKTSEVKPANLPAMPQAGALSIRGYQEMPTLTERLPEGLAPYANAFNEAARDYGLNPAMLAAISMHETANGTSKAFKEKNNAMGISDSTGPTTQESVEESIRRMARILAGRTYLNANTLDEVGNIYAPVGASNDPKKLNSYWPGGVASHYARLTQ